MDATETVKGAPCHPLPLKRRRAPQPLDRGDGARDASLNDCNLLEAQPSRFRADLGRTAEATPLPTFALSPRKFVWPAPTATE